LQGANEESAMGDMLAPNVYTRELDYLIEHEFAQCSEDILWRRTKLGLYLTPEQVLDVDNYVGKKHFRKPTLKQVC